VRFADQFIEAGFVNGRAPLVQGVHLGWRHIDAHDAVALGSDASGSGRADIAEPKYGNFHKAPQFNGSAGA